MRRDIRRVHLPGPDQVVDEVPGRVGLGVLLVGGVPHAGVVETLDADLGEGIRGGGGVGVSVNVLLHRSGSIG